VSGFRSSLRWKVKDLEEGKGGICIDEWIVAIGRGAIGNGSMSEEIELNGSTCVETHVDVYRTNERHRR
jgi:hypothetical protein